MGHSIDYAFGTNPPPPNVSLGSSLRLWLHANTGITITGTGASTWSDQSGNGNHAVQGTDAARPIVEYVAGQRAVSVDADRYMTIPDATTLRLATGKAWGVYAAIRCHDGNNSVAVLGKWNASAEYACNVNGAGGITPTSILYIGASGGTASSSASIDLSNGDETICHWKLTTGGNVHAGGQGVWGAPAAISGTPSALTNVVHIGRFSPTLGAGVISIHEIIMYRKDSGDISRAEERAVLAWLRKGWTTP